MYRQRNLVRAFSIGYGREKNFSKFDLDKDYRMTRTKERKKRS